MKYGGHYTPKGRYVLSDTSDKLYNITETTFKNKLMQSSGTVL